MADRSAHEDARTCWVAEQCLQAKQILHSSFRHSTVLGLAPWMNLYFYRLRKETVRKDYLAGSTTENVRKRLLDLNLSHRHKQLESATNAITVLTVAVDQLHNSPCTAVPMVRRPEVASVDDALIQIDLYSVRSRDTIGNDGHG